MTCWLVILTGCWESNLPPNKSWGYMNAEINGKQWQNTYKDAYQVTQAHIIDPDGKISCIQRNYLISRLYSSEGELRQELTFEKFPVKPGRYKVFIQSLEHCDDPQAVYATFDTMLADGDVLGDSFAVLETEDNYLEIEEYHPKGHEISGRFQVTFVVGPSRHDLSVPDTLRFTGGIFQTKDVRDKD